MISVRRWLSSLCSCAATAPPWPRSSNIIAEPRLSARAGRRAAYFVPVTTAVESMVAVTYVRDIGASRALYELLGFREHSAARLTPRRGWRCTGTGTTSCWPRPGRRWTSRGCRCCSTSSSTISTPFVGALARPGVEVAHTGPPPARARRRGEAARPRRQHRPARPAGTARRPSRRPPMTGSPRFSLLKEAAALVEARGGTTATCQISDIHGDAVPEAGRGEARRRRGGHGLGMPRPRRRDPGDGARGVHRQPGRAGDRLVSVPPPRLARRSPAEPADRRVFSGLISFAGWRVIVTQHVTQASPAARRVGEMCSRPSRGLEVTDA